MYELQCALGNLEYALDREKLARKKLHNVEVKKEEKLGLDKLNRREKLGPYQKETGLETQAKAGIVETNKILAKKAPSLAELESQTEELTELTTILKKLEGIFMGEVRSRTEGLTEMLKLESLQVPLQQFEAVVQPKKSLWSQCKDFFSSSVSIPEEIELATFKQYDNEHMNDELLGFSPIQLQDMD